MHNPKYEELFAPEYGPENPFQTQQMKANRNMLSGYVEKAHISEFQFENQRRTFTSYGYAVDPSTDGDVGNGDAIVGKSCINIDIKNKFVNHKYIRFDMLFKTHFISHL